MRRLRWLGHIARVKDDHMPKRLLFGWLPQCRPAHDTKLWWKGKVRKDLKKFHIGEDDWYQDAQNRRLRRTLCRERLSVCTKERPESRGVSRVSDGVSVHGCQLETAPPNALFICDICHRSFRRRQDITTRDMRRQVIPPVDETGQCSRATAVTHQLVWQIIQEEAGYYQTQVSDSATL